MATISYSVDKFHGTVDTAAQRTPETLKLKAAVQTALDAVSGANGGTLAAAESDIVDLSRACFERIPLKLTANGTWATYVEMTKAVTITSLAVVTPTQWASTGGTVLLSVKKTSSGGNTILNAATYDLETVAADTRTALTLTATTADRGIAANGLVYVSVVSNNADATGPADGAAVLTIGYTLTL